jgi:hypothetical protein
MITTGDNTIVGSVQKSKEKKHSGRTMELTTLYRIKKYSKR